MGLGAVAAGVGVLGAGASLASGVIGANAAKSAANTQAAAADKAEQTQVQASNVATGALAPYNQIGTGAENSLADLYGIPFAATSNGLASTSSDGITTPANVNAAVSSPGGSAVQANALNNVFTSSPNYKFAFDQGLQALQRSAAAGGTLISGGQLKAGEEFGQGLATQTFGQYVNNLQSLAGMGQNAAAGTASNSIASGNAIGNTQQAVGQAQASGTVGSASQLAGGLNGVSSSAMQSLLAYKFGGASPSAYNNNAAAAPVNTLNAAYENSTGNYAGLSNAGQDAIQDNPLTSLLLD